MKVMRHRSVHSNSDTKIDSTSSANCLRNERDIDACKVNIEYCRLKWRKCEIIATIIEGLKISFLKYFNLVSLKKEIRGHSQRMSRFSGVRNFCFVINCDIFFRMTPNCGCNDLPVKKCRVTHQNIKDY